MRMLKAGFRFLVRQLNRGQREDRKTQAAELRREREMRELSKNPEGFRKG